MKSILVVTDIEPGAENRSGPSSLLWEIGKYIRGRVGEANCAVVSPGSLTRDAIAVSEGLIVYPQHVLFKIPVGFWHKAIVLGPDSCVLLFSRCIRSKNLRISRKIRYAIALIGYSVFELCILLIAKKVWLVGRLDVEAFAFGLGAYFGKASYLTHPSNSTYTSWKQPNQRFLARRIIMFGDLQEKYVWHIPELIKTLSRGDISKVLVTGRRNKWLADELNSYCKTEIEFVEWVEDFSELCGETDIHFFPLAAGAGTKNRVLASLQFHVPIIASPIALENIAESEETRIKLGIKLWQGEALDFSSAIRGERVYINAFMESRKIAFESTIEKELCIGDT